jgi:hypothetical protein
MRRAGLCCRAAAGRRCTAAHARAAGGTACLQGVSLHGIISDGRSGGCAVQASGCQLRRIVARFLCFLLLVIAVCRQVDRVILRL